MKAKMGSFLWWLWKEPFWMSWLALQSDGLKFFLNFSYNWGAINCFFYKFLILWLSIEVIGYEYAMFQNNYSGIPIFRTPIFSILPITWSKSRFPSSIKRCNFTPISRNIRFLKPIFFSFLLEVSKIGIPLCFLNDNTVSLDMRIGNVLVCSVIWVRVYNSDFRPLCNFSRAIRSTLP